MRITRHEEGWVDILIQPIRSGGAYYNETSAQIVVYVVSSDRCFEPQVDLVMELYDLTRAEAEFAIKLANGVSIVRAAKHAGLTEASARTYSKRIYQKIGVHGQGELVQLFYKSALFLTIEA